MKVLAISWIFLLSLLSPPCKGQETIRGKVYDRTGSMASVIVTQVGTQDENQVFTNARGEFEIRTTGKKASLKFTFVGYAPKIVKIKKKKFIKVKMKLDLVKFRDIA